MVEDDKANFVMERIGKVSETGREFDIQFWQRQGSTAIFAAAWEMVWRPMWGGQSCPQPPFRRLPPGR